MFDRWFKRSETVSAPCVDLEAVARLNAAEQRIADLEALLRARVVELDAYRELAALRDTAPAEVVEIAPAKAKITKARAIKPAKPVKLSALDFWQLHGQAVERIRSEFGDSWRVAAPFGRTELVTLASGYRSVKTERGTLLKWPRDMRVPAADYWPSGAFPEGVTIEADYPREDPAIATAAWKAQRTGDTAPKLVERSADWHREHGYTLVGKTWIAAMLVRQNEAHCDAIEANREVKHVAALERAALSYGPQPLAEVEIDLAEAAD
jgi:hypothetical protein